MDLHTAWINLFNACRQCKNTTKAMHYFGKMLHSHRQYDINAIGSLLKCLKELSTVTQHTYTYSEAHALLDDALQQLEAANIALDGYCIQLSITSYFEAGHMLAALTLFEKAKVHNTYDNLLYLFDPLLFADWNRYRAIILKLASHKLMEPKAIHYFEEMKSASVDLDINEYPFLRSCLTTVLQCNPFLSCSDESHQYGSIHQILSRYRVSDVD